MCDTKTDGNFENEIEFSHFPVMLSECVEALGIKPDGVYVDCTVGGGSHSEKIAEKLEPGKGRLICIDRDGDAIAASSERLRRFGDTVTMVRSNFSEIREIVRDLGIGGVDGTLIDLGASSHQFDTPERGFSYRFSGKLDMRMDDRDKLTAYDIVNTFGENEIKRILFEYGEEKFAPRIASAIVREREVRPIETTDELVEIIKKAVPAAAQHNGSAAKKSFQALRIFTNNEIEIIRPTLEAIADISNRGGRIVVLTFHSLEDRAVKQTFTDLASGCVCPPSFPVCVCGRKPTVRFVGKKPMLPSEAELAMNSRSHSAKLRVAEKL